MLLKVEEIQDKIKAIKKAINFYNDEINSRHHVKINNELMALRKEMLEEKLKNLKEELKNV